MKYIVLVAMLATPCFASDADDLVASAERLCKKEGASLFARKDLNVWWQMVYDHESDTIHVNLNDKYFKDPKTEQEFLFKCRFYSTGHRDHIIRHELGHRKYFKTCGYQAYKELMDSPCPIKSKARVITDVSDYATTNAAEFVAEVYAMILDNKKIPDDINEAYRKLWRTP